MENQVTFEDVKEAETRIAPYINVTPVLTCGTIDKIAGRKIAFKCEQFQKVGAFKFRGACNAVYKLDEATAAKGVITHSSGNHAQALSLTAKMRDIPAYIVMPNTAPKVKQAAVKGYGGIVYLATPTMIGREQLAQKIMEETGATLIHSSNDPMVIAGQGTIALEFLEQVPDLDAIICAVGGGGLLAGICLAAKGIKPSIRIFGGEPKGADDAAQSLAAGKLIKPPNPKSIADGLLCYLGSHTWPIIKDNVEAIITVDDQQIKDAMKLAWERMKVIVEPSAAVPLAAVLSEDFKKIQGITKIGVIFSGGNVDLATWQW